MKSSAATPAHIAADDLAGTLPLPVPAEEAMLALTSQVSQLRAITDRAGVRIIQRTHTRPRNTTPTA